MGFKITEPGQYRLRCGGVMYFDRWATGNEPDWWINEDAYPGWWSREGYYCSSVDRQHPFDIIAKADAPAPVVLPDGTELQPGNYICWNLPDDCKTDLMLVYGRPRIDFTVPEPEPDLPPVPEYIWRALPWAYMLTVDSTLDAIAWRVPHENIFYNKEYGLWETDKEAENIIVENTWIKDWDGDFSRCKFQRPEGI